MMTHQEEFDQKFVGLKNLKPFQDLRTAVFSPNLWAIIEQLYQKYSLRTESHHFFFSRKVPLEKLIQIASNLFADDHGREKELIQGEVTLVVNIQHSIVVEFFYAANPADGGKTFVLTYVLNGHRTTNFEDLLKQMTSEGYANERFPIQMHN